ncbi:MAG: hypothetical protein CVU97_05250 [Firmicutes bacterium HGW-Firmicutes-21]|nr:MAG: hypothetical protein CVU97_05250 [Firmicutes bacterium HGW-Firmicutes-21]
MNNRLNGDGINDDTAAIQELIDTRKGLVYLPVPVKKYVISKTLRMRSDTELRLDPYTVIQLAPKSSCLMLRCEKCENVTIRGGIWDMNNMAQEPNPLWIKTYGKVTHNDYDERYMGVSMRFFGIKNLTLQGITVKNPVTFGIQMAEIYQFTVDCITFDYNQGNPVLATMDGVHVEGGCRFGRITNLKGRCFDDLLALNADDFHRGDIQDISVDGIYSDKGHSAVRMLSWGSNIRRISISNIFGTFYQYCIGLTKYYREEGIGRYDQISLRNIYASKAFRYPTFYTEKSVVYPIIFIEKDLHIKHLVISELHRREEETDIATIIVESGTTIDNFLISNCSYENNIGNAPFLLKKGEIKNLSLENIIVKDCKTVEE